MTADVKEDREGEGAGRYHWALALMIGAILAWPGVAAGQGMQLQPPQIPTTPSTTGVDWEGQTVVSVEVEGNRRVEADTVRDRVTTEAGQLVNRQQITNDIRRIHGLGYFDDVQVRARSEAGGVVLTFVVVEKPAVDAIRFVGNSAISDDDLEEELRFRRFSILDLAAVARTAEAIREKYHQDGYFLAEVDFEVMPREDRPDLAVVIFEIREYSKVEVKRVTFLGNEEISSDELRNVIATRAGNVLSFMTQMGSFQEEEFEIDLQRLTAFYYDHGFVQVQVEMPTLRLSPDKRHLYITIRIDEGPQHFTGDLQFSGDLLVDEEELQGMARITDEEVFRYSALQMDLMRLSRFYQDAGYANVRVNPLMIPREADGQDYVDVTYDIQKGELVYIGRIEVVGNLKTRDQVIRREFVIEEGELFSASGIERSQRRVERLGFFEVVNVTSQETQSPDVIDLQVQVEERPTGTFQAGMGISSQERYVIQGSVSQENLFGRGQSLQLSIQWSPIRRLFNLRFQDPRFFGSQWYFATDLYNFTYQYQDFDRLSRGGTLTFGYPIGDLLRLPVGDALNTTLRYKLEDVSVEPGGVNQITERPASPLFTGGLTSSLRWGLSYDTRDDRLFPSRGQYHTTSAEWADQYLLSENRFLKLDGDARFYRPLFWNFVLRLNASIGFVASTAPDRPVPIFERYFVGGPETVRGFERFTLGPARRVPVGGDDPSQELRPFHYGGNKQLVLTAEVEFPIFAAAQLRGVLFADAGNAFDDGEPFTLRLDLFNDDALDHQDALRTAVGVGIRWFSPIGPLRLEWGVPLQRLQGERPIVFDLSIQNAF